MYSSGMGSMPLNNDYAEWKKAAEKKLLESKRLEMVDLWTSRFRNIANRNSLEWRHVYDAYMASPLWKMIRNEALSSTGGKCANCGRTYSNMEVHHIDYDRIGGDERIGIDVFPLCNPCHNMKDWERKVREIESSENALYVNRVKGYARKVYGENWENFCDFEDVEEKFLWTRFKSYCKSRGESYSFEDKNSMDYLYFCKAVRENREEEF